MILVDSSVWIDHLRSPDARLAAQLGANVVMVHPFVIGELACGALPNRTVLLEQLASLPSAPFASHSEAMGLVERRELAGRGIGWVDVHLLASAMLAGQAHLWTRDKRLQAVAVELGLAMPDARH